MRDNTCMHKGSHEVHWLGPLLAACVAMALGAAATGATYSDASKVNLFRRYTKTGTFEIQTAWSNLSPGTAAGAASAAVDSGVEWTQLNFAAPYWSNGTLTAYYDIVLPEPVFIEKIEHYYAEPICDHRILGSLTGFGSLTELCGWTNTVAANSRVVNATAKYIRLEYGGTNPQYYVRFEEVKASPPSNAVIQIGSGYNLFSQRAAAGPIPNNATYRGGSWGDECNNTIDLNFGTYLRGYEIGESLTNWFIVPLNRSYRLSGAAVGFYVSQTWGRGIQIDVSNSGTVDVNAVWTTAYKRTNTLGSATLWFSEPLDARYVRVATPGTNCWGALCEFELFPYPGERGTIIVVR